MFLGPGGAQANLPQVYWKDIGGTVDAVCGHTLAHNRIYGVPIAPIGQTYGNPPPEDIARFRSLWAAYGSAGLSWWSWQATGEAGVGAAGAARRPAGDPAARSGLAGAADGQQGRPGGVAAAAPRVLRPDCDCDCHVRRCH